MSQINELKESRAKILNEAKSIIAKAKDEFRDLSTEESVKADTIYADFDKLGERVNTLEKTSKLELAEGELRQAVRKTSPSQIANGTKAHVGDAMRNWFLMGSDRHKPSLDAIDNAARADINLSSNKATIRALTKTGNTDLVAWREFFDGFERYLKYYGSAVNVVTEIQTDTGVDMPIPVFSDENNTGRWLGETTAATSTDPLTLGVTLKAWKASSDELSVSVEMLQDSQTALEVLLPMLLGERIGRLTNAAVTNGDGTAKPRGILLDAAASTIVSTGSGAVPTVTIDHLLDLKYAVDTAYRAAPAAKRGYMFHDRFLAQIRKAKDASNRYFADPFQAGPGTLDGENIFVNADVPSTGVNAKIACYGDFSRYLLRRVSDVQFLRLDEVRAREGMVVFLAFSRLDGRLLNPNAVKTLAAPAV